jgi:thiol-disulfide isomerase/thioredoxin
VTVSRAATGPGPGAAVPGPPAPGDPADAPPAGVRGSDPADKATAGVPGADPADARAARLPATDPADAPAARVTAADLGRPLGPDGTFLQISSAFCAPCRATRRVLERVVATDAGLAHVEVDVADRPDLAARFAVTRTPTVVLLDPSGVPALQVTGVPTLARARAAAAALRTRA